MPAIFRRCCFVDGEVQSLDSMVPSSAPSPPPCTTRALSSEPRRFVLCYTDGITEPENPYGEMFGEERLIDLVKKHAHRDDREILQIILEAVRSWTGHPNSKMI